jgi:hypothetical protein
MRSFHQDGLGTNIGKALKHRMAFSCRSALKLKAKAKSKPDLKSEFERARMQRHLLREETMKAAEAAFAGAKSQNSDNRSLRFSIFLPDRLGTTSSVVCQDRLGTNVTKELKLVCLCVRACVVAEGNSALAQQYLRDLGRVENQEADDMEFEAQIIAVRKTRRDETRRDEMISLLCQPCPESVLANHRFRYETHPTNRHKTARLTDCWTTVILRCRRHRSRRRSRRNARSVASAFSTSTAS